MNLLDHGSVELVEAWGSDESIVSAARMSTAKGFQGWGTAEAPGDEKLLRYLWKHKHATPFEMAGACFEMQLPIFVARELIRHRTLGVNELSARYTPLPALYYIPSDERMMHGKQSDVNKQGSTDGFTLEQARMFRSDMVWASEQCRAVYDRFLGLGMSRELARLIVPVNQYTKWRMQGTLRNWLDMLRLRLPENVQWETRMYAEAVAEVLKERFPRTWTLFEEELA